MSGQAKLEGFRAAFPAFVLAALLLGGAYAIGALAENMLENVASPSPGDSDQAPPKPAAVEPLRAQTAPVEVPASAAEPSRPAAPPATDESPNSADAAVTAAAEPAESEPPAAPANPADAAVTAATEPAESEPSAAPANPADAADGAVTAATEPAESEPPLAPADPIVAEVRTKLQDPSLRKGAHFDDLAALDSFYGARTDPPMWITAMGFSARAQELIAQIEKAGDWGLDPRAFDLPGASDLPASAEAQAVDEIKLSIAALKYARYARGGRLSPPRISELLDQKPDLRDPKVLLTDLAVAANPGTYLQSLQPKHEQFERLRQAFIKAVAQAKARGRKPESDTAVQRLVVNMERWRWMPNNLGSYYVWDNIPAFTARVVKDGKSIYVEKTVVGQLKYPTPIFSAAMNSIVFNPDWTVPETIKIDELQPRLRERSDSGTPDISVLRDNKLSVSYQGHPVDAETVDWEHVNILSYNFTQPPGPDNVLGVLKFNFPNRHAIYMHDTLQPEFFDTAVRTQSHGCIRLRDPERLAALLLAGDKGWPEDRVKDLIATGNNNAVTLDRPVPVYLTYFTLAFDGEGKLQSYGDIYGLDQKMAAALFGKTDLPAPAPQEVASAPQKRSAWNAGFAAIGHSGAGAIPGLFGN
jgi:L,D-transpeptidase YcbB